MADFNENKYISIPVLTYGKERKEKIKQIFLENPNGLMAVNCKYRLQTKDDPDILELIKNGTLKLIRPKSTSSFRKKSSKRQTFLVAADFKFNNPKVEMDCFNTYRYYLGDVLHKVNGPAIQYANGDKEWYEKGLRHRVGGPAIEHKDMNAWYKNGVLHRKHGPAIEHENGTKEYWINGEMISEKEFKILRKKEDKIEKPKKRIR